MNEMKMRACAIHSVSIISFINAGSKYPRSLFLSYKSEATAFMKISNNFGAVMSNLARGNSFFQK